MDAEHAVIARFWDRRAPAWGEGHRILAVDAPTLRPLDAVPGAELHVVQADAARHALLAPEAALRPDVHLHVEEDAVQGPWDAVLVWLGPHAELCRARLGRALRDLRPGGELLASGPHRFGAKRWPARLRELGCEVAEDSKHRCRVMRVVRPDDAALDLEALADWADADAVRRLDLGLRSRPGLFSWDRADPGSVRLASHLPEGGGGRVADVGAGWGWLSREILTRVRPERLHLLESDARALALARINLPQAEVEPHWCDATLGWPVRGLDLVVTNPPFHAAGRTDPDLGRAMIQRAAEALAPHGRLLLVANRHLPYERTLRGAFARVRVLDEGGGFKVVEATRPGRQARS